MSKQMGRKRKPSSDQDKVIHVDFGGSEHPADGTPNPVRALLELPPLPAAREPITDMFSGTEVCRLLGLTRGQLRSLDRTGVVSPTGRRRGRRAYTFADLIALRTASHLIEQKVRLRDVARAVAKLKSALPKVTRPLAELRVSSDGQKVIVRAQDGSFEPCTGQMLLDFDVETLRSDVVRVLRPKVSKQRTRSAYELYMRASQLDEDPATFGEAQELYRQALELDPYLAIAYTNLGNICFRRQDDDAAEQMYRRALELEPKQAEAHYNLGYVMLERGDADAAVPYFQAAIAADPTFSDAYFNLAMAFEHVGDVQQARPCWQRYIELEPQGTWAEIARKHL
ncbi:MAG: tetratricopeptide repeat protein [Myxococcota bacterium]